MEVTTFDVQLLNENLNHCMMQKGLDMDHYISSYKQLSYFFITLGSVFSFISRDVTEKIAILEKLRKSPEGENYTTIESMLLYEKKIDFSKSTDPPSGSRTLLRLHRALEFTYQFMSEVSSDNQEPLSTVAKSCYSKTLAKYHPWLIRQGALLALYTVPSRETIVHNIWGENDVGHALTDIKESAKLCQQVYFETQQMYKSMEMLDLP